MLDSIHVLWTANVAEWINLTLVTVDSIPQVCVRILASLALVASTALAKVQPLIVKLEPFVWPTC